MLQFRGISGGDTLLPVPGGSYVPRTGSREMGLSTSSLKDQTANSKNYGSEVVTEVRVPDGKKIVFVSDRFV